jgi:hypothetical protein
MQWDKQNPRLGKENLKSGLLWYICESKRVRNVSIVS